MPDKELSWYKDVVILTFPKLASLRNWANQAYVLISTLLGIQLNKMWQLSRESSAFDLHADEKEKKNLPRQWELITFYSMFPVY